MVKSNFLFDTIWGIDENELLEIITLYQSLQTGKDINTAGFKSELFPGKPIFEDRVRETDIIRIDGKLVFYQDPFSTMISSTSVYRILEALSTALKMEPVKEIVLEINSSGGLISCGLMLSEFIYNCRNIKPIISLVNNEALSCGYLIASACNKVCIASPASRIGAIGSVVSVSVKSEEVKKTHDVITAVVGKFKDINSSEQEIKKYKEASLNGGYEILIEAISRYRNLDPETLKNTEGKIFYGDEAVTLGLIDGYFDLKEWILNKKVIAKEKN